MKTTIELMNVFATFILPVVAIVVTAFVLPWLRHKSAETKVAISVAKTQEEATHLQKVKANYDLLATWASAAVVAVGKLDQSGAGKKQAAISLVQQQLDDHSIAINAANVATAIETAYAKQVDVIDNAYQTQTISQADKTSADGDALVAAPVTLTIEAGEVDG